jgi:hypothetical protein
MINRKEHKVRKDFLVFFAPFASFAVTRTEEEYIG